MGMARERRHGGDRAVQYGPYSEAEVDAALRRKLMSDPRGIVIRLLALAALYALLARAILEGLGTALLLMPLLLELLVMFAGGWLLARVIPCEAFRETGRLWAVVLCGSAVLAAMAALLLWQPGGGMPPRELWGARLVEAGHAARQHGLHWALLALVCGMAVSTVNDVQHWRREGGRFVWITSIDTSLRIALVIVGGVLLFVAGMLLGGIVLELLSRWGWIDAVLARDGAWLVWTALLLLDIGVVWLGAAMHRDLQARAGAGRPATPWRR